MNTGYLVMAIIIAGLCTLALRALPFLLFGRNQKIPPLVETLGDLLPPAVMMILLIYSVKDLFWAEWQLPIKTFAALFVTTALHVWRRNVLLSIVTGTVLYMVLVRI